ncbi:hypothetical protein BTO32_15345 [Marinobacter lutaoensis]|uniref:Uncharacterized protein n=1 Tax=Marinobacter lutaoensis TaxID=135739 RepID=A0A1V2DPZ5_9GAMM|nr:hypothetical protein [Marinobacter lutaoensis]ONF42580.1 hypothetical protein BTO32_15345 [Marinobacter lutaoensis]
MVDLLFFVMTGLIKAMGTIFFMALPWVAWRKGSGIRVLALTVIAISVAALLWWPFASGAEGFAQMFRQMWWLSVIFLVCAPLGVLAHYRREKQTIN